MDKGTRCIQPRQAVCDLKIYAFKITDLLPKRFPPVSVACSNLKRRAGKSKSRRIPRFWM